MNLNLDSKSYKILNFIFEKIDIRYSTLSEMIE